MPAPSDVEVLLLPSERRRLAGRDLSRHTAVVIDILRATSTMVTGLAHGIRQFRPCPSLDAARELYRRMLSEGFPAGDLLLAGEEGGLRPPDFHLGNSPREFTAPSVRGKTILHATTNGTPAFAAATGARRVYAGAFVNRRAILNALTSAGPPWLFICAGTGSGFSLEDALFAASLLQELAPWHPLSSLARAFHLSSPSPSPAELASLLRRTANGRHLIACGLERDILDCTEDRFVFPNFYSQAIFRCLITLFRYF